MNSVTTISLWQSNIFTIVRLSTGGLRGRHPLGRHPPGRIPPARHPRGRHPRPPTRRQLKRVVRILLECILVPQERTLPIDIGVQKVWIKRVPLTTCTFL